MGGVCFDTSALVPVVTDQLANHEQALARFAQERDGEKPVYCSTHSLAECYAVLTALPLPRRITGPEAARLIEVNFIQALNVIEFSAGEYMEAIRLCSDQNRISGQVYDALHVVAALKTGCDTLYTYNVDPFKPLAAGRIRIALP